MATHIQLIVDGEEIASHQVSLHQTLREVGDDHGWPLFEPADRYVHYEKDGGSYWRMNAEVDLRIIDDVGVLSISGGSTVTSAEAMEAVRGQRESV